MKKHIPNFFTLINLVCGALATVSVLQFHLKEAIILHFICLIADFLDGIIARKLKVDGPLGVQLDSLADVISFGVFPSAIIYTFLAQSMVIDPIASDFSERWVLYPAFILAAFTAMRLAKFNISTEQSDQFIGLPSPASAMFFAGLLLLQLDGNQYFNAIIEEPIYLYLLVGIFSYLMNSRFIHFKIKPDLNTLKNPFLLFMMGTVLALIFFKPYLAVSMSILLYSLLSILSNYIKV